MMTVKSVMSYGLSADLFFWIQAPRLVLEHHGNVILNGEGQPVRLADEFPCRATEHKGTLAQRADKDVKKARVQGLGPVVAGG